MYEKSNRWNNDSFTTIQYIQTYTLITRVKSILTFWAMVSLHCEINVYCIYIYMYCKPTIIGDYFVSRFTEEKLVHS